MPLKCRKNRKERARELEELTVIVFPAFMVITIITVWIVKRYDYLIANWEAFTWIWGGGTGIVIAVALGQRLFKEFMKRINKNSSV